MLGAFCFCFASGHVTTSTFGQWVSDFVNKRSVNSFYGHDMIVLSHLIWPSFPATAVHLGFFAAACIKIAHAQHMGK
ncbi:hypothetical protein HDV64DRAFT_247211 [Trichoderma sp. TUCIM 5745]